MDLGDLEDAELHAIGRLLGVIEGLVRRGGTVRISPPPVRATASEGTILGQPIGPHTPEGIKSAIGILARRVQSRSRAQVVAADVAEQVDELLDDASRIPSQLSLLPSARPAAPVAVEPPSDQYRDPPYEILVRLLGDISVEGAPGTLKPKQLAVLAYIALNAPVAAERIEDALWVTPTASRRKRLANTISEVRSVVGATHLPLSVDGRYRVGPGVVTDVELFERRIDHVAKQDDVAAVATLRGALELVHGAVFTYRNVDRMSYVWVDVDNWISTWELRVTDAAEDLAQRYLDLGDPEGAVWACRRGLKACPTLGRSNRMLVQAHRAGGDDVAAQRVIQSHRSAMERLDLDVDEDLVRLVD